MAVKIRLMRVGKKKQPHYRIVVVEEASKRDGEVIEVIGHYHPLFRPEDELTVDVERALSWLEKGAQPTEAARRLLSRAGVMKLWHERRFGRKSAGGAEPVSA